MPSNWIIIPILLLILFLFSIITPACNDLFNDNGKSTIPVPDTNFSTIIEQGKEITENIESNVPFIEEFSLETIKNDTIYKLLEYHKSIFHDFQIEDYYIGAADEIAEDIRKIGPLNKSFFDNYDAFHENAHKLNHIVVFTNDLSGSTFPEIDYTFESYNRLKEIQVIMSYTPILDTYNELYKSSLRLHSDYMHDYHAFYTNLFLFGSDVAFTQQKIGYKMAFKSTNELIKAVRLYRTQKIIGPNGYALLLSYIHWMIRDEINQKWDDLIDVLREEGLLDLNF